MLSYNYRYRFNDGKMLYTLLHVLHSYYFNCVKNHYQFCLILPEKYSEFQKDYLIWYDVDEILSCTFSYCRHVFGHLDVMRMPQSILLLFVIEIWLIACNISVFYTPLGIVDQQGICRKKWIPFLTRNTGYWRHRWLQHRFQLSLFSQKVA